MINDTAVLLGKREQNDIWQSLYEFPLIETTRPVGPERISALPVFQQVLGHESFKIVKYSRVYKHILSHQQIFARFYLICINGDAIMDSDGFFPVAFDEIQDYPVPRLLDKFLMGGYWSDWKSSYC